MQGAGNTPGGGPSRGGTVVGLLAILRGMVQTPAASLHRATATLAFILLYILLQDTAIQPEGRCAPYHCQSQNKPQKRKRKKERKKKQQETRGSKTNKQKKTSPKASEQSKIKPSAQLTKTELLTLTENDTSRHKTDRAGRGGKCWEGEPILLTGRAR